MTKDTGGQAFPVPINSLKEERGMTLRDYFAGQALMGLLAQSPSSFLSSNKSAFEASIHAVKKRASEEEQEKQFYKMIVPTSYGFADAMIKEGNEND